MGRFKKWPIPLIFRARDRHPNGPKPPDPLSRVQQVFDDNNIAVVVEDGRVTGIIAKIDVVEYLAART